MGNNLENHVAKRKQERGRTKPQRFYGWPVSKAQHCRELSWLEMFPIWNIGGGTTEPTAIVKIWDLPSQP